MLGCDVDARFRWRRVVRASTRTNWTRLRDALALEPRALAGVDLFGSADVRAFLTERAQPRRRQGDGSSHQAAWPADNCDQTLT